MENLKETKKAKTFLSTLGNLHRLSSELQEALTGIDVVHNKLYAPFKSPLNDDEGKEVAQKQPETLVEAYDNVLNRSFNTLLEIRSKIQRIDKLIGNDE